MKISTENNEQELTVSTTGKSVLFLKYAMNNYRFTLEKNQELAISSTDENKVTEGHKEACSKRVVLKKAVKGKELRH